MSTSSSIQNSESPPPSVLSELFEIADIQINGSRPWDIQIVNPAAYQEILSGWSLGLGESYMAGYWESDQVDELIARLLAVDLNLQVRGAAKMRVALETVRAKFINLQSKSRAFQVGEEHYDIGNDIFQQMLDSRMIYSCAYWEKAQDLEQAQTHKLEMICRKLELRPGERLLDIGCGWGGLAAHAARHHGVSVKGVTISKEQQQFAQRACADLPVEIVLMDYRDINETFDKVVSVGMFEHVGQKNYTDYFNTASRLLKDQGLFLLHTIGSDVTTRYTDPWIDKYIFPNGKTPSAVEISQALEGRFLIEDWHNFGHDYDKTLLAWHDNFVRSWPSLSQKYGPRFYRMWRYYLLACAGFFRARQGQLWQLVLSKRSRRAVYRSVRL